MSAFSPIRAGAILFLVAALLSGMTGRVAYLQTYARQDTIRAAERQQHVTLPIVARRGSILDRNGLMIATTIQQQAIFIDPAFMIRQYQKEDKSPRQLDQDLRKLARLIQKPEAEIIARVHERPDARYLRIAEEIPDRLVDEVARLDIPGVEPEPMCVRNYPMASLAAHIVGTVGKDGHGLEGIEQRFDRQLSGKPGLKRLRKDARGRTIGVEAEDFIPPGHGQHLVLTIDTNIQLIAERELKAACEKFRAKQGEVVVLDPRTGEVLALANWPAYNPQALGATTREQRRNNAIVVPYEPGSTLKPFIMGPALATGVTRLNETWNCGSPYITPYGRRVSDVHGYGSLCSWDGLVKSSNVLMAKLAARMGNPRIHDALLKFGFGRPTGIELPGEDDGRVRPLPSWSRSSTESIAQGYEMMVTPLQLARAFCVYANGGKLVPPRLVKGRLDADGNVIEHAPPVKLEDCPSVIDERTSLDVRRCLADVLVRGTARANRSKVWNIFGKTGTSHISRNGHYQNDLFNSSFLAGAPLEDPRIIVAMIIHEPDRRLGHYGGAVSAPYAVNVVESTLAYLQVEPSPPLAPPPPHIIPVLYSYEPKLYPQRSASAH